MDANTLLNAMISGGMRGGPVNDQLAGIAAGQGGGTGGGLGALLSGFGGSVSPGGSGGGGMGAGGLAGGLGALLAGLGGGSGGGMAAGLGTGAAGGPGGGLGALAGSLFGGGSGGGQTGGMALLAGLASSFLGSLGRDDTDPAEAVNAAKSADAAELEGKAMLMVRAMIAAAKADGAIDGEERQTILDKLAEAGAGAEEQAFVAAEMDAPLDMDGLVADVDNAMTAAEVYTASALAIRIDTDAERAYLDALADRLGLKTG